MGFGNIVFILLAIAAAVFVIKMLTRPIRWIFKFLIHAGIGLVLLLAVNFLGAFFGISIALTLLNILIAGIFGIPGVIVLVIISLL